MRFALDDSTSSFQTHRDPEQSLAAASHGVRINCCQKIPDWRIFASLYGDASVIDDSNRFRSRAAAVDNSKCQTRAQNRHRKCSVPRSR